MTAVLGRRYRLLKRFIQMQSGVVKAAMMDGSAGGARLRRLGLIALMAGLVGPGLLAACTVVPLSEPGSSSSTSAGVGAPFDAGRYVDSVWDSKIVPTVLQKAIDLATLEAAIKADPAAAGSRYGNQEGESGSFSFLVKGAATILSAGTDGLVLDGAGSPGGPKVVIATGPVIVSTALRDAVGFIHFSDFASQLQYADVADALNSKVKESVVGSLQPSALVGKEIAFYGAFTLSDPTLYLIVPVKLDVKG